MNKILMILSILITVAVSGEDDPQVYLQPEHIIGDWTLITSKPVGIKDWVEYDTTVFQIYELSKEDKYRYIDILLKYGKRSYLDDPLGMRILSNKGRKIYCFMNDPEEHMSFKDGYPVSRLEYNLVYDYNPDGVSFRTINFVMVENDSLEVTIGSDRYNLKKGASNVQESILQ